MDKYIVTSKAGDTTNVRKLWNRNDRNIEYGICHMRTSANTLIQASEVIPGDIFSADQANILYAVKFTPNRCYSIKDLLQEGTYKPYIPSVFPKFRSFSGIAGDFNLSFTFKLFDYCFLYSNSTILDTLKYYVSELSTCIDFYINKIALNNYEQAIFETMCTLDYLKYISDCIFQRFGNNLEDICSKLQVRVTIISTFNWKPTVYSQNGKFDLNFLNYSNCYDLIYTPKETSLMMNQSSIQLMLEPNRQEQRLFLDKELENSRKALADTLIIIEKFIGANVKNGKQGDLIAILGRMNIGEEYRTKILDTINCLLCIHCQQPGDLVKLTCSHSLCRPHFIELVNRATNMKVVLNHQEENANLYCIKNLCGAQIHQDVVKLNFPDYDNYAKAAEQRIKYQCISCKAQGGGK